jgi:DNA-3-methyladenine glycosylase II
VIEQLTSLKGIGPWTAEMFLIFGMGHPDVWSPGDLGLKKAVWAHFGEDANVTEIAERWKPFRSYAALYLWEYTDNSPR